MEAELDAFLMSGREEEKTLGEIYRTPGFQELQDGLRQAKQQLPKAKNDVAEKLGELARGTAIRVSQGCSAPRPTVREAEQDEASESP